MSTELGMTVLCTDLLLGLCNAQ